MALRTIGTNNGVQSDWNRTKFMIRFSWNAILRSKISIRVLIVDCGIDSSKLLWRGLLLVENVDARWRSDRIASCHFDSSLKRPSAEANHAGSLVKREIRRHQRRTRSITSTIKVTISTRRLSVTGKTIGFQVAEPVVNKKKVASSLHCDWSIHEQSATLLLLPWYVGAA